MIRIAGISVAIALTLAGCGSKAPDGGIKDVQNIAASICKFVPTAQTVANILLSGSMGVQTALTIATAICNAVTINPLADGPGAKNYKPHVNGVRIKGSFVK